MKWYELDKERIIFEYLKVQEKYPLFKLYKFEDKLAWEGEVNIIPATVEEPPLGIRLVYPNGFPIVSPKVYPISPKIPDEMWGHEWHRWKAGNLCYVHPKAWNLQYNASDIINKVQIWYFNFLAYKNKLIKKMPDEGMANVPIKGSR